MSGKAGLVPRGRFALQAPPDPGTSLLANHSRCPCEHPLAGSRVRHFGDKGCESHFPAYRYTRKLPCDGKGPVQRGTASMNDAANGVPIAATSARAARELKIVYAEALEEGTTNASETALRRAYEIGR